MYITLMYAPASSKSHILRRDKCVSVPSTGANMVEKEGVLELSGSFITIIVLSSISFLLFRAQRSLREKYGTGIRHKLMLACQFALASSFLYVFMRIFAVLYDGPFSTPMCFLYWESYSIYAIAKASCLVFYALRIYRTFEGSVWAVSLKNTRAIIIAIIAFYFLTGIAFLTQAIP